MVDYSKWDSWANDLSDDDDDHEKEFSAAMARMAYDAHQGNPIPQDDRSPSIRDQSSTSTSTSTSTSASASG
jgi:hypothetical protein